MEVDGELLKISKRVLSDFRCVKNLLHGFSNFLTRHKPSASMPLDSSAKVWPRSQIKMSLSTVVNLDALTSDTVSTRGNDVSRPVWVRTPGQQILRVINCPVKVKAAPSSNSPWLQQQRPVFWGCEGDYLYHCEFIPLRKG